MRNETGSATAQLKAIISALSDDPVGALSALTAEAKKQSARETIDRLLSDRSAVYALLDDGEPKARKNAARLLGALANERDAVALAASLHEETTRFVVPSILLALGSVGGAAAEAALNAYLPPSAADETEQKHVMQIVEAQKKALAALTRDVPLPVRGPLDAPHAIRAVAPAGFAPLLRDELASLGFSGSITPGGVSVETGDIARLYRARCMQEALIPAGTSIPLDPDEITSSAAGLLQKPYRIELRNYAGDRAAFIRALSRALGGGDNPSRYVDELRVECRANGLCNVFVRPCSVPDQRFAYRKRSIPASIAPSMAACLARYALSFVSANHIFALDPFCGSGTLLFELERLAAGCSLLGVDISAGALAAARENAAAAKSRARFIQKDILRFEPRNAFGLVLTNMPFGNRVGSHASNEPLYRGFVRLLPNLLADGGAAVLYTMEHRLLQSCVKSEPGLAVAAELATEAGGLNPRVTVVRKK